MASTLSQLTSTTPRAADGQLCRSLSSKDLHRRAEMCPLYLDSAHLGCSVSSIRTSSTTQSMLKTSHSLSRKDLHRPSRMRRSYSDNHLSCSVCFIRASTAQPKLKTSHSVSFLNLHLSSGMPFLFDPETKKEIVAEKKDVDLDDYEMDMVGENEKKRVNWIERLVELRNKWKGKEDKVDGFGDGNGDGDGNGHEHEHEHGEGCGEEGGCQVEYEDDDGGGDIAIDREMFSSMLQPVSWSQAKLFSRLAFLGNKAYAISDLKKEDLKVFYGLDFVTSSLEKKAEAEAIKEKIEQDSIKLAAVASSGTKDFISESAKQKPVIRSSAAYEIAASAASYVQSQAKDLISLGSEQSLDKDCMKLQGEDDVPIEDNESTASRRYKSEMAACVAASTMTSMVAAGENHKEKAAKDLQSLHSSPCEWFVCDDSSIYTRCFVIQGSDSLASWQANLFFEPTKFEGTNVLVHRGIYEAAKGIYDQFMPEIKKHLHRFGSRAKLRFTGHSLGGSLALLVNLMLLTRNEVKPSALLPVVTFGSPFIFCGGHKILEQLGLDENHVHCVTMHRDIVPRAFSCNYPNYVAQILKRLNGRFQSHPCLNKNKLLYSPMGKLFILQPDEKSSPPHPLLPPGTGLYTLDNANSSLTKSAIRAFLNSPHPIETLSDPMAYGSEGTIIRDHDSSNYSKAVSEVIRKHNTRLVAKKKREQRNQLWPVITAKPPQELTYHCNVEGMPEATKKALTGF